MPLSKPLSKQTQNALFLSFKQKQKKKKRIIPNLDTFQAMAYAMFKRSKNETLQENLHNIWAFGSKLSVCDSCDCHRGAIFHTITSDKGTNA